MQTLKVPNLESGTIWSYKDKEYRILQLSDELIQDEAGDWVQTLKYTTKRWSGMTFNRAWTDFTRKFECVTEPKKKKLRINAYELQVLMGMNDNSHPYDHFNHMESGGYYYAFKEIQNYSAIPMEKIRRTVRSLARKGLMEYGRGLMTDDGQAAGSGYRLTKEGREYVENVTKTRQLSP